MKKMSIGKLPIYRAAAPNVRDNLILCDSECGAKNLSVGIGIYNKGQASEFHTHENEEEVMIYLKGNGKMVMEDGTEYLLEQGDVTYVPANEPHRLYNTGDNEFVFLFIYAPMGPEKNIRKWDIVPDEFYSFLDLIK